MARTAGRKHHIDNGPDLQLPMFVPESDWRPPSLADLPQWPENGRVALDIETCDPEIKKTLGPGYRHDHAFIAGYSFAIEDGPSHYVPVRHVGGDNVPDVTLAFDYLRDQARQFRGTLVGANLGYDTDHLATKENVDFLQGQCKFRDVQVADPLICELHDSYALDTICARWGITGKDETLLRDAARHYNVDPKAGLYKLPGRYVGPYGEQDVRAPLRLMRRLEREIDEQGIWDVFHLECAVQPVLINMRRRGVRIDQDRLAQVETWSLTQESEALAQVTHATGIKLAVGDVWKAKALAPALEYIGVELKETAKGQPNIDKEVLTRIDHPVAKNLLWARKVNKLRTTFAQSIRTHMVKGRIHTTFNQLRKTDEAGSAKGAAFGRLSSELPNLQQQPARDQFAKLWRSIYLPEEGSIWGCLDYSQQEPRWTAYYAELTSLQGGHEAAQRYRDDPNMDSYQPLADLTGLSRKVIKVVYLGLSYGMGGAKLSRSLGLGTRWAIFGEAYGDTRHYSSEMEARLEAGSGERVFEVAGVEGQGLIDSFNAGAPFVRKLAKAAQKSANSKGFIRTIGGRRCRFPEDPAGSGYWGAYKAMNRLIQGSAADQMKKALVALDAAGYFLQLQVHDESDSSFESLEQAREAGRIQADVIPISVPFKVDVECGENWGEIEEIAA